MSRITLLAMAPSGEVLIVRDPTARIWLIQSPAAGGRRSIAADYVERVVARHGFDRIDRSFETWGDLDRFRQRRAAVVTPAVVVDRDGLDSEDVRRLIATGERWIADGEGSRALRLARELLGVPAVRRDPDLLDAVATLFEQFQGPALVVGSEPPTPLARVARQRWQSVRTPAAA